MKAREYLEKYYQDREAEGDERAAYLLILAFCEEVKQLWEQRKCGSGEAMMSILKEQNQKWNALCRLEPAFRKDGFKEFNIKQMPELARYW